MPEYRRLYADGGTYFLTVNLNDRRSDLLVREIELLRASWREVVENHPFETIAAVTLPDHMHCLWRLPDNDHDFSTRLRLIKAGFTKRLPERLKGTGRKGERNVWQSRFWEHAIRDDRDLERHIDYIHFNPVKHGYVSDPDAWPHSTWQKWKKDFGKVWTPEQSFGE